eukprot:m.263117 g.263117  ORF g.263117 m.263117 type:complete len:483 (-) comp11051_c0_seq2:80-1528(-)
MAVAVAARVLSSGPLHWSLQAQAAAVAAWRCPVRCFAQLGVDSRLQEALASTGCSTATAVQRLAYSPLRAGRDVIIHAETGCGKTLAYLVPQIQQLAEQGRTTRGAGGLVVVPSIELATQVAAVFNNLAGPLGVHATIAGRNHPLQQTASTALIVGTPHVLSQCDLRALLPACRTVVLDEVDVLLNDTFLPAVTTIARQFRPAIPERRKKTLVAGGTKALHRRGLDNDDDGGGDVQFVFVGATLPTHGWKSASATAHVWAPKAHEVVTPRANTTVLGIDQQFVELPTSEARLDAVEAFIRERPGERTLVFANTVSAADHVAAELCVRDIGARCLHKRVSEAERTEILTHFLKHYASHSATSPSSLVTAIPTVLVTTDLLARGLDFDVPNIVQYDFATDVASYLHRVGRTARAGAHGRVLNCLQPGQRALADEIQRCLEGKPAASHKDDQERGMSNLFSRKRRFRRKFARAKTPPQTSSSQAG